MNWIRRKVKSGSKLGTKIGFPTLNFTIGDFSKDHKEGVYACEVRINDIIHKGALYFGHRLSSPSKVLEIYVINFNKKIYGQYVSFRVKNKVRKPLPFDDVEMLKKQIEKDINSLC